MNFNNQYDRIEAYLEGRLDEQQKKAFDQELQTNTELRDEFDLFKMSREAVEVEIANDLRQSFKDWQSEDESKTVTEKPQLKVVSINRRRWLSMAAAACVFLVAGFFVWNLSNSVSNPGLAANYYTTPSVSNFRSGADSDTNFQNGLTFYQENKLNEANTTLNNIPSSSPEYTKAQYLVGHIAMQEKNYATAITAFKNVVAKNDPRWQEQAEWNLILAYLGNDDNSGEFISLLNQITGNDSHSYHQQAVELEGEMK